MGGGIVSRLPSRRYGTIYIGVTNNLGKRLAEHRAGKGSKFVQQYGVFRLVYVESFERPDEVIAHRRRCLWVPAFAGTTRGGDSASYGNNSSGSASNVYRCGRLRRIKPPICHQNSAAKPTRNSAPPSAPVATARASSPVMA